MKNISFCLVAVMALFCSGCATIMQGTTQDVGISSSPSGATITVNGVSYGQTPAIAKLNRKDNHLMRLEVSGYQPYELALSKGVSGWVVGNILFGGLIGLAIDAISGGMYKLTPDQVSAQLAEAEMSDSVVGDGLYLFVVLSPDPDWELVDRLNPEP